MILFSYQLSIITEISVEIRKDIPVPTVGRRGARRIYPLDELDIGDSLSLSDTKTFERARRAAAMYGKKHGLVFTSRKGIVDGEATESGGTVWRVE